MSIGAINNVDGGYQQCKFCLLIQANKMYYVVSYAVF